MNNITQIVFNNRYAIAKRISEFYVNAKRLKYQHSYGWDEVIEDIKLAYQDIELVPCNKTTPLWRNLGYNVALNRRGWAFAYKIIDETKMLIFDVEHCGNLTITYNTTAQFYISNNNKSQQTRGFGLGYGISAYRADDGYIYLYKNRKRIPDFRFNEIEKKFYKYSNGKIYAIGTYGEKRFKIYYQQDIDQIKVLQESLLHTIQLTESQFIKILTESIYKIIKVIA